MCGFEGVLIGTSETPPEEQKLQHVKAAEGLVEAGRDGMGSVVIEARVRGAAASGKGQFQQEGASHAPTCYGSEVAARDRNSGELLWEFQTDASKANLGWVLTADRRFNNPLLFFDNWREGPLLGQARQMSVGSIFSSPLVANGVVYFGSTDGYLYALE